MNELDEKLIEEVRMNVIKKVRTKQNLKNCGCKICLEALKRLAK